VGFQQEAVKKRLGPGYVYVDQGELLGTGHAVAQAVKYLDAQIRDILVVNGDDSAFYDPTLVRSLIERHRSRGASLSLLSVHKDNPSGLGRIIRDDSGEVSAIREETDASQEEKAIDEVNTGTYCFSVPFLREFLPQVRMNASKGEYYLTDLVELAYESNQKIETVPVAQEWSFVGVNTRDDLAYADQQMKKRRRR
jgi:bifunctional UDP-N-acetylglucosamine pyrophosphorylase/glucosamine-1-phosphate N-acetyltransferase